MLIYSYSLSLKVTPLSLKVTLLNYTLSILIKRGTNGVKILSFPRFSGKIIVPGTRKALFRGSMCTYDSKNFGWKRAHKHNSNIFLHELFDAVLFTIKSKIQLAIPHLFWQNFHVVLPLSTLKIKISKLIVPSPLKGRGTIYSNGFFFAQTILTDRYIYRRELRVVPLKSPSGRILN